VKLKTLLTGILFLLFCTTLCVANSVQLDSGEQLTGERIEMSMDQNTHFSVEDYQKTKLRYRLGAGLLISGAASVGLGPGLIGVTYLTTLMVQLVYWKAVNTMLSILAVMIPIGITVGVLGLISLITGIILMASNRAKYKKYKEHFRKKRTGKVINETEAGFEYTLFTIPLKIN